MSCTDNPVNVSSDASCTINFSSEVGSYWVYADTTIDAQSRQVLSAGLDSIEVIAKVSDSLGTWSVFNESFLSMSDTFRICRDTIFSRQHRPAWETLGSPYIAAAEYVPPCDSDFTYPIYYYGYLQTDRAVSILDSSEFYGGGRFSRCYLYIGNPSSNSSPEYVYTEILSPRIGFVYARADHYNLAYPEIDRIRTRWLVRYRLERSGRQARR